MDGRTPEHGYTISSPCKPYSSGELKRIKLHQENGLRPALELIKQFSCSTKMSMNFGWHFDIYEQDK